MDFFFFFGKSMGKNIGKNISEDLRGNYIKNLCDYAKQFVADTLKTAWLRAIQKPAKATGD